MTYQLTELTPEMTAKFPAHRDKWIAIGRAAGPTTKEDVARAEEALPVWYRAGGYEPPKVTVWVENPLLGALVYSAASALLDEHDADGDEPALTVSKAAVRKWIAPRAKMYGMDVTHVLDLVSKCIGKFGREKEVSPDLSVSSAMTSGWHRHIGGQFWPGWYWGPVYQTTLIDICGVKIDDDLLRRARAHEATCRSHAWWWPDQDFTVICQRPMALHTDAQGRPHCETGPAIVWPGFGVYMLHGVRVSDGRLIDDPSALTVEAIEAIHNAEERRVLTELYGIERYVADAGFDVIDEETDLHGQPRRLLSRTVQGERTMVVRLVNSSVDADGSRRVYHVPVHPELRPLTRNSKGEPELGPSQSLTARNAVASTFGLTGLEYATLECET